MDNGENKPAPAEEGNIPLSKQAAQNPHQIPEQPPQNDDNANSPSQSAISPDLNNKLAAINLN